MGVLAWVRNYFHAEAIAYDYAVSVELGTLLLEEGRAVCPEFFSSRTS